LSKEIISLEKRGLCTFSIARALYFKKDLSINAHCLSLRPAFKKMKRKKFFEMFRFEILMNKLCDECEQKSQ
jgi:hypothetical protein